MSGLKADYLEAPLQTCEIREMGGIVWSILKSCLYYPTQDLSFQIFLSVKQIHFVEKDVSTHILIDMHKQRLFVFQTHTLSLASHLFIRLKSFINKMYDVCISSSLLLLSGVKLKLL